MLAKYKNHVSALLIYLGQNSLCIVIWQFVAFRIAILIQIISKRATFRDMVAFPTFEVVGGWWLIYTVTGIYGSLVIDKIIRYLRERVKSWYAEFRDPNRRKKNFIRYD